VTVSIEKSHQIIQILIINSVIQLFLFRHCSTNLLEAKGKPRVHVSITKEVIRRQATYV